LGGLVLLLELWDKESASRCLNFSNEVSKDCGAEICSEANMMKARALIIKYKEMNTEAMMKMRDHGRGGAPMLRLGALRVDVMAFLSV